MMRFIHTSSRGHLLRNVPPNVAKLLLDSSASLNNSSEKNISGRRWLVFNREQFLASVTLITVKRLIKIKRSEEVGSHRARFLEKSGEKPSDIGVRARLGYRLVIPVYALVAPLPSIAPRPLECNDWPESLANTTRLVHIFTSVCLPRCEYYYKIIIGWDREICKYFTFILNCLTDFLSSFLFRLRPWYEGRFRQHCRGGKCFSFFFFPLSLSLLFLTYSHLIIFITNVNVPPSRVNAQIERIKLAYLLDFSNKRKKFRTKGKRFPSFCLYF